jgi:hypothetical protein
MHLPGLLPQRRRSGSAQEQAQRSRRKKEKDEDGRVSRDHKAGRHTWPGRVMPDESREDLLGSANKSCLQLESENPIPHPRTVGSNRYSTSQGSCWSCRLTPPMLPPFDGMTDLRTVVRGDPPHEAPCACSQSLPSA